MRWLLAIALATCVRPLGETRIVVVRDLCESRFVQPAIRCESGELGYDGCRWACRLEPSWQGPARMSFDEHGYKAIKAKE